MKYPVEKQAVKKLIDDLGMLGHSPRRSLAVMLRASQEEGYVDKEQINFAMHFTRKSGTHTTYSRNWEFECAKELVPFQDWLRNFVTEYAEMCAMFGFVNAAETELEGQGKEEKPESNIVQKGDYEGLLKKEEGRIWGYIAR